MSSSMQAAFDKATSAILKQGEKCNSGFDGGSCYYRHPSNNDLKCAIGHLLSDNQMKKYTVREGQTPDQFQYDLLKELIPDMDAANSSLFLESLQQAHDAADASNYHIFRASFIERCNQVASQFGLTPIKPNAV